MVTPWDHLVIFPGLSVIPGIVLYMIVVLVAGVCPVWAQSSENTVQRIEVEGNHHIEQQAIVGKLSIQPGEPFSQEKIRQEIQNIYSMGFFEEVEVDSQLVGNEVVVVFQVKEKPFTVEVVYDGNDELSDDKLGEKNTIRSQTFLDQEQVKVSAEHFRKLYQEKGYFHAEIVPIVDMIEEGQARLTYYIEEGKQAHIKTIDFEGRNVFGGKTTH